MERVIIRPSVLSVLIGQGAPVIIILYYFLLNGVFTVSWTTLPFTDTMLTILFFLVSFAIIGPLTFRAIIQPLFAVLWIDASTIHFDTVGTHLTAPLSELDGFTVTMSSFFVPQRYLRYEHLLLLQKGHSTPIDWKISLGWRKKDLIAFEQTVKQRIKSLSY